MSKKRGAKRSKRKTYVVKSAKAGWMAEFASRLKATEYANELYYALPYGAPYWVE